MRKRYGNKEKACPKGNKGTRVAAGIIAKQERFFIQLRHRSSGEVCLVNLDVCRQSCNPANIYMFVSPINPNILSQSLIYNRGHCTAESSLIRSMLLAEVVCTEFNLKHVYVGKDPDHLSLRGLSIRALVYTESPG